VSSCAGLVAVNEISALVGSGLVLGWMHARLLHSWRPTFVSQQPPRRLCVEQLDFHLSSSRKRTSSKEYISEVVTRWEGCPCKLISRMTKIFPLLVNVGEKQAVIFSRTDHMALIRT
jgi:hypothetical protein